MTGKYKPNVSSGSDVKSPEVLVGTAGWNYEDWVGPFYPERPEKGFSRLEFYSKFFDCVEVNSTFYRHFGPKTIEKWLGEVEGNANFEFIIKLYKNFTHGKRSPASGFRDDKSAVEEYLAPLVESAKLGGLLVQFSEYFRAGEESRSYLAFLLHEFRGYRLFVELRHLSWYSNQDMEFLKKLNVNLVVVDQPMLNGMVGFEPEYLGKYGYVRLHGRNIVKWSESREALAQGIEIADEQRNDRYNYLYTTGELDEIERKIRVVKERCDKLYVVANNHPLGKAVANALELLKRLRDQDRVRIPSTLIRYFPELGAIADRVDVGPELDMFDGEQNA